MRRSFALSTLLGVVGLVALTPGPSAAQYYERSLASQYASGWENDRLRVRTVSIEPGSRLDGTDEIDRVLVFLTADLDGRIPQAEAIFQPARGPVLENRGRLRATAVVIDVKPGPASTSGVTPPEALSFTNDVETERLIDNAHVTVTKVRYRPNAYVAGPWHFHAQDALLVYLRGGQAWPQAGGYVYSTRVRRGDIDVIPGNTLHTVTNAGSDPLEFLIIAPK